MSFGGGSVTWPWIDGKVGVMPTPSGTTFQDGTGYLLAMAGAAARRQWVEMLARFDVTPSQFKVVMSLGEVDSLGQRQLADLIDIDPRNCVPIVDALVQRGLVSRETDGTDRRRRVLRLSRTGRRLAEDLAAVNVQLEARLMSPLGPTEQSALHRMLVALLDATEAEAV